MGQPNLRPVRNITYMHHQEAPQSAPTSQDVFPEFAASPEEIGIRNQQLRDYIANHMRDGEDYGVVPGGSKPTLFKPGAEKLNAVYGLTPIVNVTNRVENWEDGFIAYEVKVTLLNKRSGGIEAEGVGSCNSRERRYKNQDAANVANTILKMAKKRALVDATLSATRASGMFEQDLEDDKYNGVDHERSESRPSNQQAPQKPAQRPQRPAQNAQGSGGSHSDTLTDAQHRAILAIAGRVFGRNSREEDLTRLVDKPLDQLSKGEASALIDRLRGMVQSS